MILLKLTQFRKDDGSTSPLVIANPDNLFIQATTLSAKGQVPIIGEPETQPKAGSVVTNGANHTFVIETVDEIYALLLTERRREEQK